MQPILRAHKVPTCPGVSTVIVSKRMRPGSDAINVAYVVGRCASRQDGATMVTVVDIVMPNVLPLSRGNRTRKSRAWSTSGAVAVGCSGRVGRPVPVAGSFSQDFNSRMHKFPADPKRSYAERVEGPTRIYLDTNAWSDLSERRPAAARPRIRRRSSTPPQRVDCVPAELTPRSPS